ncbi:hypothetical protein GCM10023315_13830 [Algibacter aquimarinus]|uniref:Uncharacterized protein n=1 Tax=Algibacter aquimarinus TaxID=1136748 RepID=A0ABP9HB17_9FLAO
MFYSFILTKLQNITVNSSFINKFYGFFVKKLEVIKYFNGANKIKTITKLIQLS